jgi:hypothetical protein
MNANFKREPEPAVTWVDAPAFAAQGYAPMFVESDRVAKGHETPYGGGWAWYVYSESTDMRPECRPDHAVGILTGLRPRGSTSMSYCSSTWIATLRIDCSDAKLVRDIEKLIAPHLRWAEGCETRHAPVRMAPKPSSSLLIPFRLDNDDPRTDPRMFFRLRTRKFCLPSDEPFGPENCVSIESDSIFVATTPYRWRGGLDLRAVHRNALPITTVADAEQFIESIEAFLDDRGIQQA